VRNLKKTVISAATVISGGATDVANLDDFASDFGDWFRSEASQATLDWIYSESPGKQIFSIETLPLAARTDINASTARTLPTHAVSGSTAATKAILSAPKSLDSDYLGSSAAMGLAQESLPLLPASNSSIAIVSSTEPAVEGGENTTANNSKKRRSSRFSWLRISRQEPAFKVRGVMDDPSQKKTKAIRKLPRRLKVVFVGDGATGKTSFMM
jgi:hypothetical protein